MFRSLELFIVSQWFISFLQSQPCSDVLWKDESFIALETKEPLPSQCIPDKVFFNSTGHKFCIKGSTSAKASEIECKSGPSLKFRLPTNVVPVKYFLTFEPDLAKMTTIGFTTIDLLVKSPTKEIVLHANATALKIDSKEVSLTRTTKGGQYLTLNIRYQIMDAEKEFYRMILDEELQPNEISGNVYQLNIYFQGTIFPKPDDKSLFTSEIRAGDVMVATHFERSRARTAFPCFDEPAMKASFQIVLKVPFGYGAISNAAYDPDMDTSQNLIVFKETPIMSTYLVAFVLHKYRHITSESSRGVMFRTFYFAEKIDLVKYASEVGPQALTYFENVFGNLLYPLEKMDFVPVPDVPFGGEENWGLTIFNPSALLYKEDLMSVKEKFSVLKVIVHELAHNWVGNLVTMRWWNDLWLKEGFATYFHFFVSDLIDPDAKYLDRMKIDTKDIMRVDGWGVKDIYVLSPDAEVVNTKNEAKYLGNSAYNKGACIIQMLDKIMTHEKLMKGLNKYLKESAYKVTIQDDLWAYLEKEVTLTDIPSLSEVMKSWTKTPGFPIVTVTRNYESGTITLRQEGQVSGSLWWIPLDYIYASGGSVLGKFWMENKAEVSSDIVLSSDRAVIFNINWDGYYIVNYDTKNWDMIANVLIQDHTRISVQNRAQILHDIYMMHMLNTIDYLVVKKIYGYLKKESEYLPWKIALKYGISLLLYLTLDTGYWVLSVIGPVLNDLGYSTREQDKHDQISLRAELLKIACELGDQKCRTEAEEKFKMWKESKDTNGKIPIDPNYQTTFIGIGILSGKTSVEIEENIKFVVRRAKYEEKNIWDIQFKRLEDSLKYYYKLEGNFNAKKMSTLIRKNPHMLEEVGSNQFISEQWVDVLVENWSDILKDDKLRRHLPNFLNSLSKSVKTQSYLDKMESLKNLNYEKSSEITDMLDTAIKNAISSVKWWKNIGHEIKENFQIGVL